MDNYDFDNPWQEDSEEQQDIIEGVYAGHYAPVPNDSMTAAEASDSNKKKLPDWLIIAVLVVLVLVVGFFSVKAAKKGTSIFEVRIPVENQTQVQGEAPSAQSDVSTDAPSQQDTAAEITAGTMAATTEATLAATTVSQSIEATSEITTDSAATVPTTEHILKAVSDGINSLKDPGANFKGRKTQVISMKLVDCSVSMLVEPVNKVLDFFAGEKVLEYDFTAGKAQDPESGEEITSAKAIPPTDKPFTLTAEGVAEAKHERVGENDVYTLKLVPESSNLASPRPPHHNAACDTLDFSAFELPMGEVTKADFEYPGATVSVTINPQGKIISYHERLDMKGTGEGKLGITAGGTIEGYIDEKWDIEWK